MANPLWPTRLPQIVRLDGNYSDGLPDNLSRFEPDKGPAIVTRGTWANPIPMTGTVRVNDQELGFLEDFYLNTLDSGALAFDWQRQYGPGDTDDSLSDDADSSQDSDELLPLATYRFVKPPAWRDAGVDVYDVTLSLERLS